jgi:hypothetical protein
MNSTTLRKPRTWALLALAGFAAGASSRVVPDRSMRVEEDPAVRMKPRSLAREFRTLRNVLKKEAAFVTDTAKAATLLLAPLGLGLLVVYLARVGAPLPIVDASTAVLLLLIAGSYTFVSCLMIAFIFAPAYACFVNPRDRDLIKTRPLFRKPLFTKRNFYPLSGKALYNEYLIFHGPSIFLFLAFAADFFLDIFFEIGALTFWLSIVFGVIIGLACAYAKYKCRGVARIGRLTWYNEFRKKALRRILWKSFWRSCFALVWMLVFFQAFVTAMKYTWLKDSPHLQMCANMGFFIVLMLFYMLLTSRRVMIVRIPAAIIATALYFAFFATSFAGGVALQALGVGGGIPISLTLTPTGPSTNKDAPVQTELGCLILRSGSETIIRPLNKPTQATCTLHWSDLFGSKGNKIPPRFSEVEAIPNSRILQINVYKPH